MSTFDKEYWDKLDKEIPGWISEEEARFLVDNVQGDNYLEIGVAYGKSARLISHHFPNMDKVGIDLIDHGLDIPGFEVMLGNSLGFSEAWAGETSRIDTLFIDGDHTYKGCLSDFVYWFYFVKPGGRIIFHDYNRDKNHEGVTQAVDAIKPLLTDFKQVRAICAGTKPN